MKRFFSILGILSVGVIITMALTSCGERKTEMPVGEIMANATTNATVAQNVAVAPETPPAPVTQSEVVTTPPVEVTVTYTAPTPEEIQTALKNAGYYTGAIDGKIGPKSKKAIEAFQQDNGLVVDGKVGKKTWGKLRGYLNKPAAGTTTTQLVAD